MKIAYVFPGHLRTFRSNGSLRQYLLNIYPGDMFVHTYSRRNVDVETWHRDGAGKDDAVTDDDIEWLDYTYPEIVAISVDPKPGGYCYAPPGCEKIGPRKAFEQAHELRNAYEKLTGITYDVVFQLRFDLVFHEPFVMPETIDPNTLYGGLNLNMEEKGLDGDVWSYGHPNVMNKVYIPAFPPEEIPHMPSYGHQGESANTAIRKRHGFAYRSHKLRHSLLRSTGLMHVRG